MLAFLAVRAALLATLWPLFQLAQAYSAANDNHPAIDSWTGPTWRRLNPFGSWAARTGCRPDPLNVLAIGFAPVWLWPVWWVAVLDVLLVALYARYLEPQFRVVAGPWEPEDPRDAGIGAVAAVAVALLLGLAP